MPLACLIKDAIRHFQVKGDHIAMIPNRENLIVVGSEDVEGLAGMVKLAAKAMKEPRPISGIALRLDGDDWTPWLPDASHPSYKAFQELQLQSFGQDYAQQKEMLDKLHEKNGEDVFVANFSAIKSPRWQALQLCHMDGHDEFAACPRRIRSSLVGLAASHRWSSGRRWWKWWAT